MTEAKAVLFATLAAVGMSFTWPGHAHAASGADAPLVTPPGITLQPAPGRNVYVMFASGEAKRSYVNTPGFLAGGGFKRSEDAGYVLADVQGKTLYARGTDAPCDAACAKTWQPAHAPTAAKTSGRFSVVARGDVRQWAYNGKLLYTFTGDAEIGDIKGNGQDQGTWRAARLDVASDIVRPYGIDVAESRTVNGYVFVDQAGFVVYAYGGKGEFTDKTCTTSTCAKRWRPVSAPRIAHAVGDFTIVQRTDGVKQWAFKGKPLFTFAEDLLPGDTFGVGVHKNFDVATVARNFIPDSAGLGFDPGRGPMVTTKAGLTLYRIDTSYHTADGHGLPGSVPGAPKVGRTMGTASCNDRCLERFRPFVATARDLPSGFWEIMDRSDGTRQWAYKGFALYTYTGDKTPGERSGSDIYTVLTSEDLKQDIYRQDKFGAAVVRNTDSAGTFTAYVEP